MVINISLQIWIRGKNKALHISQKHNENEGDWKV